MLGYQVVDAFTGVPFGGNPAAVLVVDHYPEDARMAAIAREMNLSESAFLVPVGPGHYRLRWFTPATEVELCGHATLASAHTLWERGELCQELTFQTLSGELLARRPEEGWIELDFPATPPVEAVPPEGLLEALGCQAVWVGRSRFDVMVEVASEETVRQLRPDHSALARTQARGIMVTARGRDYDCVSRFFAPREGIPEDPVTGSAHCALGPYWGQKLGTAKLRAYQASSRGGELRLQLRGDRVLLGGQAVTTARGQLLV